MVLILTITVGARSLQSIPSRWVAIIVCRGERSHARRHPLPPSPSSNPQLYGASLYMLLLLTTATGTQRRRRPQAFLMCGVNRYVIN